jgi:quercetin dioxygenase-like cupin family protein
VEILRFGPGYRRAHPREGTRGLADGTIWADEHARVTELAFSTRAFIAPQTSPHLGLLIVVAGGGWVQVGDETAPVHHGEAVEWPPGVTHGAWTDGTTMRAILVELPETVIEAAHARLSDRPAVNDLTPARGRLADREVRPDDHDPAEGEPW